MCGPIEKRRLKEERASDACYDKIPPRIHHFPATLLLAQLRNCPLSLECYFPFGFYIAANRFVRTVGHGTVHRLSLSVFLNVNVLGEVYDRSNQEPHKL